LILDSLMFFVAALLDLFLCYLICKLIYNSKITTLIAKGGHQIELHDTVSATSSGESGDSVGKSSSDSEENDARFKRRMNEATHRDSFRLQGIRYYECVKATSQWFNEIAAEIQS
jgi:hypothetical protein